MNEKVLVIHQGALGDVVLSFAALLSLKQHRDASITLLCKDQVGKIAHDFHVVDAHFSLESARFCGLFSKDMNRHMKDFINQYDTVIYIGLSGEVADCIRDNHRGQTLRISPRPSAQKQTHVAAHMARQMEAEGLLRDCRDVPFPGPLSDAPQSGSGASDTCDQKRPTLNSLLVHPGAGSKRKRWPLNHFMEMAAAMKKMDATEVAFLVGPAEPDVLSLIEKGGFPIHRVEDLPETAALIKTCTCFVGNDSGLVHLAAFMGVPTVAIFGPSSPHRWSPLGPATKVLRGEAECDPCFETAETNCDDPQCLHGVSVKMVVEAVTGFTGA